MQIDKRDAASYFVVMSLLRECGLAIKCFILFHRGDISLANGNRRFHIDFEFLSQKRFLVFATTAHIEAFKQI